MNHLNCRLFTFLFTVLLTVSAANTMASNGKQLPATESLPVLAVLGASYAGEWGSPVLSGYRTVNYGIGGNETSDMLSRVDGMLQREGPDVVLIWGFINDITRAGADQLPGKLEQTKSNILEITDRVAASGARPVLATETTLSLYRSWDQRLVHYAYGLLGKETYPVYVNKHVQSVNEWVRNAATTRGVAMLDIESSLRGSDGARRPEFSQEDGSHLSAEAYGRLTSFAEEQLPRLLAEPHHSDQVGQ